jgi:hypothetical protein
MKKWTSGNHPTGRHKQRPKEMHKGCGRHTLQIPSDVFLSTIPLLTPISILPSPHLSPLIHIPLLSSPSLFISFRCCLDIQ